MKKINQNVEINFVAPSIQDVITMLPVVDTLVNSIWDTAARMESGKKWAIEECRRNLKMQTSQLRILMECGFVPSVEINATIDNLMVPGKIDELADRLLAVLEKVD